MGKNLLVAFFLLFYQAKGQQDSSSFSKEWTTKQKLIIGGLVIQQAGSFVLEYKWWWQNNYQSFRYGSDGMFNNYSYGMDKVGHFYTSYVAFNALNELMRWGEFSRKSRILTSTILPFTWALSIELGDGFTSWGFSYPDLMANTLGIGYGLIQEYYPYMRNFKIKWSYYPTRYYIQNNFSNWTIPADYGGHIYWLSFDVHGLLPTPAKRYWPAFLNLAVGYGVVEYGNTYPTNREWAISIDWNLSSFKTKNKTLHSAMQIIDYVHFPAPGIYKVNGEATQFKPLLLH